MSLGVKGPRLRVLLVDDHESLAQATADFLRTFDLDVKIASSGEEALELAAIFPPEIVVCDMRLQDLSGLEVARALRASHKTRNALLAISTALSDLEVQLLESRANSGDVDLFLSKPLTQTVVTKLLATFAHRRHRREPAAPDPGV